MSAFSPKDFEPLTKKESADHISRPSLSYWQDAMLRFKKNKRAVFSAFVVIFMVLLSFFGKYIWTVSPTETNLGQSFQKPSWSLTGKTALIVDDYTPLKASEVKFIPAGSPGEIKGFSVLGDATSVNVRLQWQQVAGAREYLIYRNEVEPLNRNTLGLPLGKTKNLHFDDGLKLELIDYYYSLVPLGADGSEGEYQFLKVPINMGFTLAEAQKRKIKGQVGDKIELQAHPLGTDSLGRDILARVIQGGRISLFIGIVAPLLYVLLGILIGGVSGYFGGAIDNWIMRVTDFVIALPFLLFMILFKVIFGNQPGSSDIGVILFALVVLAWTGTARLVRGQILQLREEPYIQAARMLGAKPLYIIMRHMVPNVMAPFLIMLTAFVGQAILTEASLSYLGMGVQEPTAAWGLMLQGGAEEYAESAPWVPIWPGVAITLAVFGFNLFGDAVRDVLDPKLRSQT